MWLRLAEMHRAAVVRGEHDQGVVGEAQFLQFY